MSLRRARFHPRFGRPKRPAADDDRPGGGEPGSGGRGRSGVGDRVETGTPRELFEASIPADAGDWQYPCDVAADGERFLIQEPADARSSPLTVVLNWQAQLKP